MKTASMLFGLLTVACGSSRPEPSYPLCDREGAPACGNVGQVGRTDQPIKNDTPRPHPAPKDLVGAARTVPIVNVLLGASSHQTRAMVIGRPLVDHREEVACGNVMTKGGPQRVCREPAGER
jgi:hypothetical protein